MGDILEVSNTCYQMSRKLPVVKLYNIPNYFSSYYLRGLLKESSITYVPNKEFNSWNGLPILIFKVEEKLIIIDNRDPVGIDKILYTQCDHYYATNKLLKGKDYSLPKVRPLFPHYPINLSYSYLRLFKFQMFIKLGFIGALKDLYAQLKRPIFKNYRVEQKKSNYIFYSGSIWKKEQWANSLRAKFIDTCINYPQIKFEGGLVPRRDGNMGFDNVLGSKRYSTKEFKKKSACSLVNFNNPAVLGAISWRVGEYLNMGTFILSLPWEIELPIYPIHGKEIHIISDINKTKHFLDYLIANKEYHDEISCGAKKYFNKYCKPNEQISNILREVLLK